MKKNWIFVILSLAVLFSLGFLPAPVATGSEPLNSPLLKPTSKAPVELSITNKTDGRVAIYIGGDQNYSLFIGPGYTGKIKIKPGKYNFWVMPDTCDPFGRDIKILRKTKLTVKCGKIK